MGALLGWIGGVDRRGNFPGLKNTDRAGHSPVPVMDDIAAFIFASSDRRAARDSSLLADLGTMVPGDSRTHQWRSRTKSQRSFTAGGLRGENREDKKSQDSTRASIPSSGLVETRTGTDRGRRYSPRMAND